MSEPIVIRSHADILLHCIQQGIAVEKFNSPVVIPEGITDCHELLFGCKSFNHPIRFPDSVENCDNALAFCEAFAHPVKIPRGVKSCHGMFDGCPAVPLSTRLMALARDTASVLSPAAQGSYA